MFGVCLQYSMVSHGVLVHATISYLIFTVRGNSLLVLSSQEATKNESQGHYYLQCPPAGVQRLAAFLDCSFYFVLLAHRSHSDSSPSVI